MRRVEVKTRDEAYQVLIGAGLLGQLDAHYPRPEAQDAAVLLVADDNTYPLYGETVTAGLEALGYRVEAIVFPAGEASKTAFTLGLIHEAAFQAGLTRSCQMVALGGGVVGDLCGFAAATYMRGIPYIQIPTTLLAQVDSSVGGKTGIDTPYGKNLIGAFKQPALVLVDTDTLQTLPPAQLASGMAEVIKYGLLDSPESFAAIEGLPLAPPSEEIIAQCVQQKADIVEADEREQSVRAFLNLGHTVGHALEKAGGYTRYLHGEGVGLGLIATLRLGETLGVTPADILPRLLQVLKRWQLPTTTELKLSDVLPEIVADKKRQGKGTKFVLLEGLGQPIINWISDEDLQKLAESLQDFLFVEALPEMLRISASELRGEIWPPPSKSEAHRLILCTALATGEADFTKYLTNYKDALSVDIRTTTENIRKLIQAAPGEVLTLDCQESGSTVRFLIPLALALGVNARFTGKGRLPERPLDLYREALSPHGAELSFPEGKYLPLTVRGKLWPGAYRIPGDSSSQYITGILMALVLLDGPSTLTLTTPLESAAYVDLTLDALRSFGQNIAVSETDGLLTYEVTPVGGLVLPEEPLTIERDYSQAAFWYLAEFLGQDVRVKGMNPSSLQGDRVYPELLERLRTEANPVIDVSQVPDLFPALAVAAARAGVGKVTRLENASRLRIKESDRLAVTENLLGRLGVETRSGEDYLEIVGADGFRAAKLESYGDHRLAMVGAIAATVADGESVLERASAIAKSYPTFYKEMERLGAKLEA